MKKNLLLTSILALSMLITTVISVQAACPLEDAGQKVTPCCKGADCCPPPMCPSKEDREARKAEFEKKLNLTEAQRAKIKELNEQKRQEIMPVIENIKAKKLEIKNIMNNAKLSDQQKEAKVAPIKEEIQALKKQAMEIRQQNMIEFEAILTSKQKKTFEKMKEEGRKKFQENKKQSCEPKPGCPCKK